MEEKIKEEVKEELKDAHPPEDQLTNEDIDSSVKEENDSPMEEKENNTEAKSAEVDEEIAEDSQNDADEAKERLKTLEAEHEALYQRFLRLQADFENFKRRTREEKARERQFRAQDLVTNLLPVLDNFERALAQTAEHEETKALLQGMEMVYRQLTEALKQEGVVKIEAEGQPFDPNKHQAVMQVESAEHDANTVVEELQAGYELNGRVIRPSMVKVSQ
nr:nucleotide exchange factor GrpE [Tuberibacillus calidus]